MGAHESNPELWKTLTSIEQISPRGWPRYVSPTRHKTGNNPAPESLALTR